MEDISWLSLYEHGRERTITVIGTRSEREPIERGWKSSAALSPIKGEFRFESYAPDHWQIPAYGFVHDGKPTTYVQEADGKVLLRMQDYQGGEKLAETLSRLRPDYDPKKPLAPCSHSWARARPRWRPA